MGLLSSLIFLNRPVVNFGKINKNKKFERSSL